MSVNDVQRKRTKKRITIGSDVRKHTESMSGKLNMSAEELTFIETEYIKSLQRHISFLELEKSYLQEQVKKATERYPLMVQEAVHISTRLKEMHSEVVNTDLKIKQKSSHEEMLISEKERIKELLNLEKGNYLKEKSLITDELVTMKKEIVRLERELADKNDRMMDVNNELDRCAVQLNNADIEINVLKSQLERTVEQHNITQASLEEKQAQLITTKSRLEDVENKYVSSINSSRDDQISEDLRSEIRSLHQKLKETELKADNDRFLKDKISNDMKNIVQENSSLNQKLIELTKELEKEKILRESTDQQNTKSMAEVVTLNEKLNETSIIRDQLKNEHEKSRQYLDQLEKEAKLSEEHRLQINVVMLRLSELDRMQKMAESEKSQLHKEKGVLVDHVTDLNKKVEEKGTEIVSLMARSEDIKTRLKILDAKKSQDLTQQGQNWEQFSNLADSMKTIVDSMMVQTSHSAQPPHQNQIAQLH